MPGIHVPVSDASFEAGSYLAKNGSKVLITLVVLLLLASGSAAAELSDTLVGTHSSAASGDTGP